MRIHDLRIKEYEPFGLASFHKGVECDFRRIGLPMKHGLCTKHASDADTVNAAYQVFVKPAFCTVGPSLPVYVRINPNEIVVDPVAVRSATVGDNLLECGVETDFKPVLLEGFGEGF